MKLFSPRSGRQSKRDVFVIATSIGRSAGSGSFHSTVPGVSLRFTPGLMLSAASRAVPLARCGFISFE